jgi:nucleoside-diphosphate kinase
MRHCILMPVSRAGGPAGSRAGTAHRAKTAVAVRKRTSREASRPGGLPLPPRQTLPLVGSTAISRPPRRAFPARTHNLPKGTLTMAIERTFSIIKPDAVARNLTGAVNAMIEQAGLRIIAQKRVRITREQAETFYAVHKARPFFGELVDFMISGPVVVQVLEGDNAIAKYRDIMGATDPAKAAPNTIRKVHAKSIGENSVHGSDAPDTAATEIAQFFSGNEIVG